MTKSGYAILLILLCLCFLEACDSTSKPPDDGGGDKDTTYKIDFEFRVRNLRPLRDGEYYSLWVKQHPDTGWKLASDSSFNRFAVRDSTVIFGRFTPKLPADSIYSAMMTIERTKTPASPGIALLVADVVRDTGFLTMDHLGDFSKTTGGLTFTSDSLSEPDAYKREFYLMRLNSGVPEAGISTLPKLNSGWRYGLWVADYEFFPYQEFLYGLFDKPAGHDSDSATDRYAFPGGVKKQRLDVLTGRIIVTLEPPLYGDSLRYKGAELLYVLQLNRFVQIERNRFYLMANASGGWLPSGRITFIKR